MKHKSERTRGEFWEIRSKLRLILCDADHWLINKGLPGLNVTQVVRSELEQWAFWKKGISPGKRSVHEFYRGADTSIVFPEEYNQQLIDYINHRYIYDKTRPHMKTVVRHGGTADHLHWQVLN